MVVTCSDTRTSETDTSGQLIMRLLKEQGHRVVTYHLVKDEPLLIKNVSARRCEPRGFRPSSSTAEQVSLGGIRHSKPSMRCWKNGWTGWRDLSGAHLPGYRLTGHHDPRHRWYRSRLDTLLNSRLRKCGTPGHGKTHPSRTRLPRQRTYQVDLPARHRSGTGGRILPQGRCCRSGGSQTNLLSSRRMFKTACQRGRRRDKTGGVPSGVR